MASVLVWLLAGAVSIGAAALIIPKELAKRWSERIVNRLDPASRRLISRFDRRYREFLLSNLRFIDLKGLATMGFYTPELDEVFVDVSLAFRAAHQVPDGLLAQLPADVSDRHSIGEFLDREQPVVLAVIGVPGSGKTTLLRHTARTLCREHQHRQRSVPILLYLRDHVPAIVADQDVGLANLVRTVLGRYGSEEPPAWFEQKLTDGDCVVLLDGLDEVAKLEDRRKVANWVERQTRQYPGNDFVITSRPQGYRSSGIDGAVVLQVRSFTDEQVRRFVRGWYLAVERHSTGTTGEDVGPRAESAANDLLERLNDTPALDDLTINPLLLTMIANVHRYRGALPGSRADLYGEICQVMLWRRQEAKNLPIDLSGDKKEAMLRGLAFTMMQQRVQDLPRSAILAAIKPVLRRMSTSWSEQDFLTDVSSNGLLIERESGLYSFAHLTFQEYLAAAHIRDKGFVNVLANAVDDVWWRETTLLYAAKSDADQIVEACLRSGSTTALSLAFDCVEQHAELAPEFRARLDGLLGSTHSDPKLRHLMAGVLVARYLHHSVRLGRGGRICIRPISAGMYRLYMQDTENPAPDGDIVSPDEPVTGARGSDALNFVRWVNGVTEGETRYRLLNSDETNDAVAQRTLVRTRARCAWLQPEGASRMPELWTPHDSVHPHVVDAAALTDHIIEDMRLSTPTLVHLLLLSIGRRQRRPGLVVDIALGLIRDIARENNNAHLLARTLVDARNLAHTRHFKETLAHACMLARELVFDVNRDLAHGLALELNFPVATPLVRAMSHDRMNAMTRGTSAGHWSAEFSRAFIDSTRTTGENYVVSPDLLLQTLCRCRKELRTLLEPADTAPTAWAYRVASRIEGIAFPMVTRAQPIDAGKVTAIRLAALSLAIEADERAAKPVGDMYRKIAAGVTLLERRASGLAPVTETIILATV